MDQHPNHQNPVNYLDDHWFRYFDDDHWFRNTPSMYRNDDTCDLQQFFNLLDMNRVLPLKQDHFSASGYPYFDPIDEYLNLWDCWDNFDLPMLTCIDDHSGTTCGGTTSADQGGRNGKWRSRALELEEIEKHFELPIAVAAEKLGVGLTMLKKRCREFNIKRWPHRKLKSIKSLIQNVKEMGLNEEMEMLEEQKRMIMKVPEMELPQRTKKLRQACFKASYKKRRFDSPY
ncbi:putative transcription factor Nin-like family [Helianthus debilis subsp. tardiflorus]